MKGWCVNLMHHPFRFMNQYVTAIGFSVREIVSRSCRGCRKAARVARVESRPTSACESACSCNAIVARRASSLFSRSVERSETYGKVAQLEAFPVRESSWSTIDDSCRKHPLMQCCPGFRCAQPPG